MAGPPVPDVVAVVPQFRDQGREVRIVRMAGGGEPEPAEHRPGLGLPVQVHLPGAVGGEHPAHEVALAGGQRFPVGEQFPCGGIRGQYVPAASFDEGGEGVEALDQISDAVTELLGGCGYSGGGGAGCVGSVNEDVVDRFASSATSSRRSPVVRRRVPAGKPTSAGTSRSRRDRSSCPSACGSPASATSLSLLMPVPVTARYGYQCRPVHMLRA